ncbi:MAG TPA: imelysin family protein [Kofleriaceae bacterium]|nr:imelysin family protein [Kofleriaceae bacterium]
MFKFRSLCACALLAALAGACGGDDGDLADAPPVVDGYVAIVRASYADSLQTATALRAAVDAFVAAPSMTTLQAAKTAWLAAREPYGQTEVYRFYDGPIDNPDTGPEGQINSWPLDEAYIDYVMGSPMAGIVNNPAMFPTLTKELIADQNELGAEDNISSGYHAIEFLLWGQDMSPTGPGARPHTDYLTGVPNHERRGQYLRLVAELLVDDLTAVSGEWAAGADYEADFRKDPKEALRRILQGMGSLSGAELSGERMTVALDNRDQEDEHSCFSDNTHRDIRANALAIQNAYLGRYGTTDGPGLDELVAARDAALDTKMKGQLDASLAAIAEIPVPFDQAIANDTGRAKVMAAVRALQAQTETLVEIATLFGIQINLE